MAHKIHTRDVLSVGDSCRPARVLRGLAITLGLAGIALSAPTLLFAATPQERGAQLYLQRGCSACHGAEGRNPVGGLIPKLAGQDERYIVVQLHAFRTLQRDGANAEMMWSFAQLLNGEEIEHIATYLSQVP